MLSLGPELIPVIWHVTLKRLAMRLCCGLGPASAKWTLHPQTARRGRGGNIQARRQAGVLRARCGLWRAPRFLQELVVKVCHLASRRRNSTLERHEKLLLNVGVTIFKFTFEGRNSIFTLEESTIQINKQKEISGNPKYIPLDGSLCIFYDNWNQTDRVFAWRTEVTARTGEAGTVYWFGFIALTHLKG